MAPEYTLSKFLIEVPDRIGPYELQQTIGRGADSVVKIAQDKMADLTFACKIISRTPLNDATLSARYDNEIKLIQSLDHPNIMKIIQVYNEPDKIFVIMELCAKGTLYQFIIDHKFIPEIESKGIFYQMVSSINYLHSQGVSHRNLNLESILLDSVFQPKIAEFYSSHSMTAHMLLATQCGSPLYAPPEMIRGHSYDGCKADIWSLGIILFAMVAGALPWSGQNEAQLLDQIVRADFVLPQTFSPLLCDLVKSILQKDPNQRPSPSAILTHPWLADVKIKKMRPRATSYIRSGFDSQHSTIVRPVLASNKTGNISAHLNPRQSTIIRRNVPRSTRNSVPLPSKS